MGAVARDWSASSVPSVHLCDVTKGWFLHHLCFSLSEPRMTCSQFWKGHWRARRAVRSSPERGFASMWDLSQKLKPWSENFRRDNREETEKKATQPERGRNWEVLPPSPGCCPGHKEPGGIAMTMTNTNTSGGAAVWVRRGRTSRPITRIPNEDTSVF